MISVGFVGLRHGMLNTSLWRRSFSAHRERCSICINAALVWEVEVVSYTYDGTVTEFLEFKDHLERYRG